MARPRKTFDSKYVNDFMTTLHTMFPEVKKTKIMKRKECVAVMKKIGTDVFPTWITNPQNLVERAVYRVVDYVPQEKKTNIVKKVVGTKIKKKPNANSRAWSSGKNITKIKKTAEADTTYDNTVEFDDVRSVRSEFGLGEVKNSME